MKQNSTFESTTLVCKRAVLCMFTHICLMYRAIPLTIFEAEIGVKKHYLRKWLKAPEMTTFDIREVSILSPHSLSNLCW